MQITGVARALQAEAAAWREDEAAAELMAEDGPQEVDSLLEYLAEKRRRLGDPDGMNAAAAAAASLTDEAEYLLEKRQRIAETPPAAGATRGELGEN